MDMHERRTTVLAAVDRLLALYGTRNPWILDEFAEEVPVLFVPSFLVEPARGRGELAALMKRLFDLPFQLTWEWHDREVWMEHANMACIFAKGEVVVSGDSREERRPYTLTGVLERQGDSWKWRQFHGSQPASLN
jgi:hypothetical protein